jgi:hypothetical protein
MYICIYVQPKDVILYEILPLYNICVGDLVLETSTLELFIVARTTMEVDVTLKSKLYWAHIYLFPRRGGSFCRY